MNAPDRNSPCHCGSGRKYKKCCMESDAAKIASKLSEDLKARQEKARKALASAERKVAEAAAIAPPPGHTAPPPRPRQKLENRSSRVSAWLPSWFNDADTLSRIEAMARMAKGKWKDQEGSGRFGGWVQDKGSMPIRVEGSWDPPDLEGSCSECGSQERCVHIAAMARSLEGTSPSKEIGPHEETHPCVPVLAIRRWNFRQGKQVRRHDGARLSFRYGPKEIDEHDKIAMISWVGEAGPVRCPRDRQAEGAMRQRLDELGWKMHDLTGLRKYHDFSLEGILDFLERDAPVLRQEGWVIEIDDDMGLTLIPIDSWSGTWTPGDDGWFGIGLSVSFAGRSIDLVDLCRRILSGSRLDAVLKSLREGHSLTVEVDGGCIRLPPERLLPIFTGLAFFLSGEGKGARVSPLMAARLGDFGLGDNSWQGIDRLAELRGKLSGVTAPVAVALPDSVKASLRPYQQTGLSWLQWLVSHGFGGILADDMGLGKTLQTIAHIACEHEAGRMSAPALVVCPTSLTSNWADELARFAPGLQVLVLHGSDRHGRREQADQAQVVITTYSLLARDEEWLISHPWHMVVFDEAQTLKNARTQARTVARAIQSTHKLALTGTPMENHLGELWSLFDLVVPGLLGTERHFGASVRNRIEKLGDMDLSARLRSVVSPFLLRRTKDAVASELPEKTEIVIHVDLEGKQRDLYETVRAVQDKRLRSLLAAQSLETSSIQILEALLRLRQTCCDPRLLPPELAKGCRVSAKIDWLARSLPEMVEEGRRILVFSQFTGFLDLAQELLSESGISFLRLDGSTADRGAVVRDFQSGKAPVFLLSLKAGGTGLNLTAADSVIFLDPWWNPAVEAQAMDRAHRIGQTKSVFVYRLVARGTVEEKILSLQTRKAELAASILEGGGAASLRFTSEDLAELMRPLG